ncbi:hypothetical protein FRC02_010347 [Tulasnella sp. 418]|nr:hypothetical protein FRC02_010347 [Tulasnella sp. 418]
MAEAAKTPIISDAIGSLLAAIDIVEEIRCDKETCIKQVKRAGEILLNVHESLKPFRALFSKGPHQLTENEAALRATIHKFSSVLEEVQIEFQKHSSRNLWQRFWRKYSISEDIADLSDKFEEANDDFKRSLSLISAFSAVHIVSNMPSPISQTSTVVSASEGLTLQYTDFVIKGDASPRKFRLINSFWSNMAHTDRPGILVKRYLGPDSSKKKEAYSRDLSSLIAARHGNLPQFYGCPADVPEIPFLTVRMSK